MRARRDGPAADMCSGSGAGCDGCITAGSSRDAERRSRERGRPAGCSARRERAGDAGDRGVPAGAAAAGGGELGGPEQRQGEWRGATAHGRPAGARGGQLRLSLDKARNRASFLHKQHKEGTFCGGRGGSRQPNKRLAHKNANRVRSTGQTQKNRTKRKERSLDADSPLRLSIARKVADAQPQVEVHRPSGAAWQSPGDAREGTAIPAPKGALWCRAHG